MTSHGTDVYPAIEVGVPYGIRTAGVILLGCGDQGHPIVSNMLTMSLFGGHSSIYADLMRTRGRTAL